MLERYYIKNKARFSGRGWNLHTFIARVAAFGLKNVARLRNQAFEKGIFRSRDPGGCVVAVGSFFVGGAGKTPFCILLAEALAQRGIRVGFVSRGYRAKTHFGRGDVRILSRGEGPELDVESSGDEPLLISTRLPQMPFAVGRDRVKAAKLTFSLGAEVVIADDALQHRRLKAAFEIELRPNWARSADAFFPRGERRDESRPVDALVGVDSEGPIAVKTVVKGVYSYNRDPISLARRRVVAFAGIAHPERFFETLEELGAELICRQVLPDHGELEGAARQQLLEAGVEADWIICTEKDLVKLSTEGMNTFSLGFISIEHEVTSGKAEFNLLLDKIVEAARRQSGSLLFSSGEDSL